MLPRTTLAALVALIGLATPASSRPQFSAVEAAQLVPGDPSHSTGCGSNVALDGDTALVTCGSGGIYVYVRSGATWIEQDILVPSGSGLTSIDLDGDVAVIGQRYDGTASVFRRTGTAWAEEQVLATTSLPVDDFGQSVAVEGDTIVVGAPYFGLLKKGRAFVFEHTGGVWTQVQALVGSDTSGADEFGVRVELEGDTLAVSASHDHLGGPVLGATYVFTRSAGIWTEQAELIDPTENRWLYSLSGDRLMLGDWDRRWFYERSGTTWSLASSLVPPPASIPAVFNENSDLDGDVAVFGMSQHDGADPGNPLCDSGAALLFTFDGEQWVQRHEFSSSDVDCGDMFGRSVAVDGDTALVGSFHGTPNPPFGKSYVFHIGPDAPSSYCTSGTSASGCTTALQAAGSASVSAAGGFTLSTTGAPSGTAGLFFFGTSGRQATTWGNGTSYRCVAPPVRRLGPLVNGGTSGTCDGSFSQDLNALWCPTCPKPQLNPGLGTAVQAQLWYSDPANTSNQSSGLSDAIEFAIGF